MSDKARPQGVRHKLSERIFHWGMAISVIVLGTTAFLPIIGIRFNWVPLHWIFGIVLTLIILFHLYRVMFVHGLREMTPGLDDIREIGRELRGISPDGLSDAKFDAFQKGYHLATAVTVLVIIGTGLVMLARIDTTFWSRNPSLLTDYTWGVIYVLHGAASLVLLFLVILHIYFAFLPEHWKYLKAMLTGKGPEKARKGSE